MRKKIYTVIYSIIIVIFIFGCGDEPITPQPGNNINDIAPAKAPQFVVSNGRVEVSTRDTNSENRTIGLDGLRHPEEAFCIEGGIAYLRDTLKAGTTYTAPVTIVNGMDHARTFHLSVQSMQLTLSDPAKWLPEELGKVFAPLPEKFYTWIHIEDLEPKIPLGGARQILVSLNVPYNFPTELRGKSYSFGILVEDWSQTGFVQIAPKMHWLVTFET